ncbi:MAG TPA: tRNA uracil 4-sulfurtransferase ThiI [Bacillales bacterium]|nr:tRNA uracil 4-sulfurtransferase ThiI [Bacillales bacterium]
MNFDHIIIRYGELSLKGKNRNQFIDRLYTNVRRKLESFDQIKVKRSFDRMYVRLNGEPYQPVIRKLQDVFGIQALSVAVQTESNLEAIQQGAIAAVHEVENVQTFKVSAKRIDKTFPIHSQELNRIVGGYVLENGENIKVDVHNPDVDLRVEVKKEATYISGIEFPGAGGLPVGVGGKVMLMLSGGIDSPVAGFLTMKRGAEIEAVHFHSPPYTNERAKQKVTDLCRVLTNFGSRIRLHVVHFTPVQEAINEAIPDNYRMTIMRRMMVRIVEKLAEKNGVLAAATGESLGQVASQTLESMNTINEVTNLPMLRPVLAMDKTEITAISKRIGTYDISIRPYEDCCTVFVPAAPKTKPTRERAGQFELNLKVAQLVDEAVEKTEILDFKATEQVEEDFQELF